MTTTAAPDRTPLTMDDPAFAHFKRPPERQPGALVEADPPPWLSEERTALHEAGHAVADVLLGLRISVAKLHDGGGGEVRNCYPITSEGRSQYLVSLVAGGAAEMIAWGAAGPGWLGSDFPLAWQTADAIVKAAQPPIPASQAIGIVINAAMDDAETVLRANWPAVVAVAAELRKVRTLDDAAVRRIVEASRQ